MTSRTERQSGFAAIAAVVLLTVLAAMGAYMVGFSNTQQLGSARDIQGVRAYWAARAGLEWALGAVSASPSACPASAPATVNTGSTYTLTVTCTMQTYAEGANTVTIFSFQSQANAGTVGQLGYVERSLSATYEVPQ